MRIVERKHQMSMPTPRIPAQLFILAVVVGVLCCTGSTTAQTRVDLTITGTLASEPFVAGKQYYQPTGKYYYTVSRLSYYVSGIEIVHDGGQTTPLPDRYLLVHGAADQTHYLGEFNGTNIEGIRFNIGVDEENNHKDPTLWPMFHPLAPQNPSMHWGWTAGYRFLALEGYAGTVTPSNNFEIHSVGNHLLTPIEIVTSARTSPTGLEILLTADYSKLLNGLQPQWGGLINHGGDGEAVTAMQNFADGVFTPSSTVSVDEEIVNQDALECSVFDGNILVGGLRDECTVSVVSMSGQVLLQRAPSGTDITINAGALTSGVYAIVATDNQGTRSATIQIVR